MAEFTSGNSGATDHWGATGVAAMMEPIDVPILAEPGGTPYALKFGNGANQVLSGDSSGNGHALTGAGFPMSTAAVSTEGSALYGKDIFAQAFTNELCVIGCGYWSSAANAGVFARFLVSSRAYASSSVGGRAACYPA